MVGKAGDPLDQNILEGVTERVDLSPARTTDFLVKRDVPEDIAKHIAKEYALKPRDGVVKKGTPPKRPSTLIPAPAPKDLIKVPTATATVVEQQTVSEGCIEAALLTADRERVTVLPIRASGRREIAWRAVSVRWRVVSITIGLAIVVAGFAWIAWNLLMPMSLRPPAVAPSIEAVPPTPSPALPASPAPADGGWETRTYYGDGMEPTAP